MHKAGTIETWPGGENNNMHKKKERKRGSEETKPGTTNTGAKLRIHMGRIVSKYKIKKKLNMKNGNAKINKWNKKTKTKY